MMIMQIIKSFAWRIYNTNRSTLIILHWNRCII